MAFKRQFMPRVLPASNLDVDLVGIGMTFANKGSVDPNIEDTLFKASFEALEKDDFRLLSVLTTWIGIHYPCVNTDRLTRIIEAQECIRMKAYWSSVAKWLGADRRFARMERLYTGPRLDLLRIGTAFQVRRHGEDKRFLDAPLRVPNGALRTRSEDVFSPRELARVHPTYRWRKIIGPSYRADLWATLVLSFYRFLF